MYGKLYIYVILDAIVPIDETHIVVFSVFYADGNTTWQYYDNKINHCNNTKGAQY